MCDNFKDIFNNGQYDVHCLQEEPKIDESDLNVIIKQEFGCDHCPEVFKAECASNNHNDHEHYGEMCEKNRKEHLINHGDEINTRCNPCESHIRNDELFQCDVCPKSFGAELSHSNKMPFKCNHGDICGKQYLKLCHLQDKQRNVKIDKSFKTKENLAKHKGYVHATMKLFQCHICPKSFALARHFKRHMASHNGKTLSKCDKYSKTYNEQYGMVNHNTRVHSNGGISCVICGKLSKSHSHLKMHMTKHSDERNVQCDKCDKRFKTKHTLIKHMKCVHATEKSFQCRICPKSFALASYLKEHITSHSEKRLFKCDQCPKKFKTQHHLGNHKAQVHSSGGKFSCDICGKLFMTPSHLKPHMTKHSDQKNIRCDECGKKFKTTNILTKHIKYEHATVKSFQCQFCPKSFAYAGNLKQHIAFHNEERPFHCDQCPKMFKVQHHLVRHKAQVHSSGGKYSCDLCDKLFMSPSHLKAHMFKHSDEKNIHCEKCDKTFKTKRILIKHMKCVHATVKSFQCQICPKSFTFACNLKQHIASHEKRPFKCDQCPKTFKTQHHLVRHNTQMHSSLRKLPCDVCGKLFMTLAHLKLHINKHSDQEIIHCNKCDKTFRLKYDLSRHIKMVHATEQSFQCQICPKSFALACNLKRHIASHDEKGPLKCDGIVDVVKVEPTVLYDSEMKRNVSNTNLNVKDDIEDKVTTGVDIKKERENLCY